MGAGENILMCFKVDKLVKGMRRCVVLLGLLATALRVHGNGQSCVRTAPPARACGAGCLTADLLCHLRPWRSANPNKRTLGLRGGMMIYKDIGEHCLPSDRPHIALMSSVLARIRLTCP